MKNHSTNKIIIKIVTLVMLVSLFLMLSSACAVSASNHFTGEMPKEKEVAGNSVDVASYSDYNIETMQNVASLATDSISTLEYKSNGTESVEKVADAWTGNFDTSWYTDHKDDESYEISTAAQLAGLATLVNGTAGQDSVVTFSGKTITLTQDIDLNSQPWIPIGKNFTVGAFQGTFDGGDHEITNLNIDSTYNGSNVYAGLFGSVCNGTIQNVGVKNNSISVTSTTHNVYVGGVVGYSNNSTVSNCYSTGVVNGSGKNAYVGGVVGHNYNSCEVSNCYSAGTVSGTSESASSSAVNAYVGGVAGGSSDTCEVSNCYFAGAVSGKSTNHNQSSSSATANAYVGGVVGESITGSEVSNCYFAGTVLGESTSASATAESYVGGIVGESINGTITNCFAHDYVTVNSTALSEVATLVGEDDNSSSTTAYVATALTQGGTIGTTGEVKSYYLESSITGNLTISGTVNLNLNGFTIDASSSGSAITVSDGATLNLFDSQGYGYTTSSDATNTTNLLPNTVNESTVYGGLITGGNGTTNYGGGVYVVGTFNMYGGTIAGNTAKFGGGVAAVQSCNVNIYGGNITGNNALYGGGAHVNTGVAFTMNGGSITGNTATEEGGGVYVCETFKVSGSPVISGNTLNDNNETPNNVYLPSGKKITINGELTDGASIGVSMKSNTGEFATVSATNNYKNYFQSDGAYYVMATGSSGNYTLSLADLATVDGNYIFAKGMEMLIADAENGRSYIYFGYKGTGNTVADYSDPDNYAYNFADTNPANEEVDFNVEKYSGNTNATAYDLSSYKIYGGDENGYTGNTRITITGGTIGSAFSGCANGTLNGTANLDINLKADLTISGTLGTSTVGEGITSFADNNHKITYSGRKKAEVVYFAPTVTTLSGDNFQTASDTNYNIDDYSFIKVVPDETQNGKIIFAIDFSEAKVNVAKTNGNVDDNTSYTGNKINPDNDRVIYVYYKYKSKTYNEDSNGDTIPSGYYVAGNWEDSDGGTIVRDAGSYKKTLTANEDSQFYGTAYATFTVNKKAITISGTTVSEKTYDGGVSATVKHGTPSGIVSDEDVEVSATAKFASKNANETVDATVTYTLSGADIANYTAPKEETLKGKIAPKTLHVQDTSATNKIYDGNVQISISGGTLDGVVSGDNVDLGGKETATIASANVGQNLVVTTAYTISGTDSGNYTLSQPTDITVNVTSKDIKNAGLSITLPTDAVYKTNATDFPIANFTDENSSIMDSNDYSTAWTLDGVVVTQYKDAGEYEYTISGSGNYTGTLTGSFTVAKKPVSLPTASTLTYNGVSQTGVAVASGDSGIYTVEITAQTNVGSYEATAKLNDKNNYIWDLETDSSENQTVGWSIGKKDITAKVDDLIGNTAITFGDEVPAYSLSYEGFVVEESEANKKPTNDNDVVFAGYSQYDDVKTYVISVATGNYPIFENYNVTSVENGSLEVKVKAVDIIWADATTIESDLVYSKIDKKDKISATYVDVKGQSKNATVSIDGEVINVGEYEFTASISDANYSVNQNQTKEYSISPKPVTFTWTENADLTYTGTSQGDKITATVVGGETGDTFDLSYDAVSGDDTNACETGFTKTVKGLGNDCYMIEEGTTTKTSGAYKITPKVVSVVWTVGTYEYSGSEITTGLPTALYENIAGEEVDLNVAIEAGKIFKDYGDYVFSASLKSSEADSSNYVLKTSAGASETGNDLSTKTVKIGKAYPTISIVVGSNITYDGEIVSSAKYADSYDITPDITYAYTGDGTISVEYHQDSNGEIGEKLVGDPKDAGTYWIVVDAAAGTNNEAVSKKETFTIQKAKFTVSNVVFANKTYLESIADEKAEFSVGVSSYDKTGLYGNEEVSIAYANNNQKEAGTYEVQATFSAGDNYADVELEETATLTIIEAHTVTFHNGDNVEKETVYDGFYATKPTSPTKESYKFIGWYVDEECKTKFSFSSAIKDETQIYAGWEKIKTYTVTFQNGDEVVATQSYIPENSTVTRPNDPTGNSVFVGWNIDKDSKTAISVSSVAISEDITFYAIWKEAENFDVTFQSNGGTTVPSTTVLEGGKVTKPTNPTKADYKFVGWYKDSSLISLYDFEKTVSKDITIYAKWVEKVYEVAGDVEDGDDANINGAKVEIMIGKVVYYSTTTSGEGKFKISNVPAGSYNIVVSYAKEEKEYIVTRKVKINDETENEEFEFVFSDLQLNSKVEVTGETDVVVDGLDQMFETTTQGEETTYSEPNVYSKTDKDLASSGAVIEVVLKVTDVAEGESEDESTISEKAGSSKLGMILDISLEKTVIVGGNSASTNVYELNNLVEVSIILPEELQGKNTYSIVRMHNGNPDIITTQANEHGEYLVANADKTVITANICRFSTYAIAFSEITSSSSSSSSLDTHAPTIKVDGEIATVYDPNLTSIKINGVEVHFEGSTVEIDLAEYGNGTHEVVATDKYGRTSTKTVVVSSVKEEETPSKTEKPQTTQAPTVSPETSGSSSGYIIWIVLAVAIAIGIAGYAIYKKKK